MSDERPLALADLAEIDAPEVVSAALSKFRRRMFVRGVLVPAVIAGIVFLPRLLPERIHSYQREFSESRNVHTIGKRLLSGRVDVVVLEARRVDARERDWVGVRLVVTTDDLKGRERLAVGEPILGTIESCKSDKPSGSEPQPPITTFSSWFGVTDRNVADLVLRCPVGTRSARLDVGAYYNSLDDYNPSGGSPPPTALPRGPRSVSQDECAVPLNPIGFCALTKTEGTYRHLATITIDLENLRVPPAIWRTP